MYGLYQRLAVVVGTSQTADLRRLVSNLPVVMDSALVTSITNRMLGMRISSFVERNKSITQGKGSLCE